MEPLRRNLSGGVQAAAADIYMSYIYVHISRTYIDAEFDVESDGMVYLASKGHLHQDICEKHAFLNVCLPPTARVSPMATAVRLSSSGCAAAARTSSHARARSWARPRTFGSSARTAPCSHRAQRSRCAATATPCGPSRRRRRGTRAAPTSRAAG